MKHEEKGKAKAKMKKEKKENNEEKPIAKKSVIVINDNDKYSISI